MIWFLFVAPWGFFNGFYAEQATQQQSVHQRAKASVPSYLPHRSKVVWCAVHPERL